MIDHKKMEAFCLLVPDLQSDDDLRQAETSHRCIPHDPGSSMKSAPDHAPPSYVTGHVEDGLTCIRRNASYVARYITAQMFQMK